MVLLRKTWQVASHKINLITKVEMIISSVAEWPTKGLPWLMNALAGRRKIALYGDMGAGKTTLVKTFCEYLGVTENTASPTFSLINQYSYPLENGATALFHHLDLYRLRTAQEAFDIGIEDLFYDPWYCFIEWPQLIENLLPPEAVRIQLEVVEENVRRLLIL